MVRTTLFSNKKYILSSGREIDLTAENEKGTIILTTIFNALDPIKNVGHSSLMRLDTKQNVSIESVSANSSSEGLSELSKPIEGLNGEDKSLQVFELNELISVMQQFLQKIVKEVPVSS